MIVLDMNVLSEAPRPIPEPCVLDWLASQPRASWFTTSVTQGEVLDGIRLLSDGKRRRGLGNQLPGCTDSGRGRRDQRALESDNRPIIDLF
jgi:predicted nucleic acid-binding protein